MKTYTEFWNLVDKTVGGCWIWQGRRDKDGYGSVWFAGYKTSRAHRIAWFLLVGPIDDGMMLDHRCRNRACVNPEHLRVVTPKQNSLENSVGVSALLAQVTHCKKGHPLEGDNLYLRPKGGRRCIECNREAAQSYRDRHREKLRSKWRLHHWEHRAQRLIDMREYYYRRKARRTDQP